jgi:peptidoglycan/xylan/chitin deacetylase (PgdA/CDA1 family)
MTTPQPTDRTPSGAWARPVSLFRRLLSRVAAADFLAPALRPLGRGLLAIFTLHRFTDPEHGVVGHDAAALRDNLAYLRRHRYRLLSMTDVLKLIEEGDGISRTPAVAFTVDDGHAGFARIAAPIFAEYDCPVTLFVPTGFLDGQLWLWWDRTAYLFSNTRCYSLIFQLGSERHSYRWSTPWERDVVRRDVADRLEGVDAPEREAAIADLSEQLNVELPATPPPASAPISWDDVRRTAKLGVTFGPHSVTHPILPLATDEVCNWEIQESYRRLRQETDACVPVFCYPAGKAGRREFEAAQRAGLRAAVTTVPTYAAPHGGREWGPLRRFALPRFPYPKDRAHVVNVAAGLARLKEKMRFWQDLAPWCSAVSSIGFR